MRSRASSRAIKRAVQAAEYFHFETNDGRAARSPAVELREKQGVHWHRTPVQVYGNRRFDYAPRKALVPPLSANYLPFRRRRKTDIEQEFNDAGKVVRFVIDYDMQDFMRQLGAA